MSRISSTWTTSLPFSHAKRFSKAAPKRCAVTRRPITGRSTDDRTSTSLPRWCSRKAARPGPETTISHLASVLAHFAIPGAIRSEEHTSELPSLMRISYAVLCLKTKKKKTTQQQYIHHETQRQK